MKRFLLIFFILSRGISLLNAQHILPADILVNPNKPENESVIFGSISLNSNEEFLQSLGTSGQFGILQSFIDKKPGMNIGATQIFLDCNPIIIGWDPFSWKGLGKNSVDSFHIQKLPYSEDCFLHFGIKRNWIKPRSFGEITNKKLNSIFGDLYWRPYKIEKDNNEYGFSVVNVSIGWQCSPFVKSDVPSIFGFSITPVNYMYINESDNYLNSYKAIVGNKYKGVQYIGPGVKIMYQYKFLNFYFDIRQYLALDKEFSGHTFTQNPTILVGAFVNGKHKTDLKKSSKTINTNKDQDIK